MGIGSNARGQLLSVIERIENVEKDQADLATDKKEIYAEAKGSGFDTSIIRKLIARRKKDPAKLAEEAELLDLYDDAIQQASRKSNMAPEPEPEDFDDIA